MKILRMAVMLIVLGFGAAEVSHAEPATDLVASNNMFAFDLYDRYAGKQGNVFFSPYSLFTALGMVYEGARGVTAEQMRDVLHLSSDNETRRLEVRERVQRFGREEKPFELRSVNALWVQRGFALHEDYLDLAHAVYAAKAADLDLAEDSENSRITINHWVSEQTNNKITDLLPSGSLNSFSRMVLTNAIYFKGEWTQAFDRAGTQRQSFWIKPDQSVDVPMMAQEETFFYMENDQVQVINLPYKGNELSMAVILPRDKDIRSLEAVWTRDTLRAWWKSLQPERTKVFLPSFEFSCGTDLADDLRSLGMSVALGLSADFSGITDLSEVYISGVFHQAWVKVDEQGTEAAAATAVVGAIGGFPGVDLRPNVFRADHPFIFIIHENKTGEILFMGRVSDPRER